MTPPRWVRAAAAGRAIISDSAFGISHVVHLRLSDGRIAYLYDIIMGARYYYMRRWWVAIVLYIDAFHHARSIHCTRNRAF